MSWERIVFEPAVLVCNVSPHFGAAVARHLRERGWSAQHVARAREALHLAQTLRPRALVTGYDEGDLDAFEFVNALRALPASAGDPRIRVIVCGCPVALAEIGKKTLRRLGIDVALPRPFRFEAIEQAVGRLAVPEAAANRPGRCVPSPTSHAEDEDAERNEEREDMAS